MLERLARRAAGLADVERRLLTSIDWAPLAALDACRRPPDEAPPPLVADEPPEGPGPLAVLPVRLGRLARGAGRRRDGRAAAWPAGWPAFAGVPARWRTRRPPPRMFKRGGIGVFEAGTGMGKSLGYLLPAAFAGAASGRRILVEHQDQGAAAAAGPHRAAARRREPAAGLALGAADGPRELPLPAAPRRGRGGRGRDACPTADRALALAYLVGRARRGDVDLSALPYRAPMVLTALPDLARELSSSRATCLGRYCPARRGCHWRLARSRAEAAHLVCVNHALLLSGRETLPAFEDVVIDEAHLLYHEATEAFSDRVDAQGVDQLLGDLRGRHRQRPLPQRLRAAARKLPPDEGRAPGRGRGRLRARGRGGARAQPRGRRVGRGTRRRGVARRPGRRRGLQGGGRRTDEYTTTVWLTAGLRDLPEHDRFLVDAGLLAECLARLVHGRGGRRRGPARRPPRARRPDRRSPTTPPPRRSCWATCPRAAARRRWPGPSWRACADASAAPRRAALGAHPLAGHAGGRHPRDPLGPPAQRRPHQRDAHRGRLVRLLPRHDRAHRRRGRPRGGVPVAVRLPPPGGARARARPRRRLAARRSRRPPGRAPQAHRRRHRRPHARAVHQQARHAPRGGGGGRARGGRRRARARPGHARQRGHSGRGVPLCTRRRSCSAWTPCGRARTSPATRSPAW